MRQGPVVGNRDACGRCKCKHGGNDHYCPVHGAVSSGCCEPACNPEEWVWVSERHPAYPVLHNPGRLVQRASVDLTGYDEEAPYKHQVGKPYVRRFVKPAG